jgi:hypothetical protein
MIVATAAGGMQGLNIVRPSTDQRNCQERRKGKPGRGKSEVREKPEEI